jgi:hypothetical protein
MTKVRLGSASIIVSFNDKEGLVVRHGSNPDLILASKPAAECEHSDWDKVWNCFQELGLVRHEI